MRLLRGAVALAGLAGGCSSGVMIAVEADEPISSGVLLLNERPVDLRRAADGGLWARWDGPDAHGAVTVTFRDGATASCPVGYVTPGMAPQQLSIRARRCALPT